MPWIEKTIKTGFMKKKRVYEEVKIVATRNWTTEYDTWTDSGTEYLVKDKKGKMFVVSEIYS